MQPIILITVYRRYHELLKNIDVVIERAKEFRVRPKIFVVWVNPEIGRTWIFKQLVKEGKVAHIITRLTDNKGSITYEESRNIRKGLEFIRDHHENYFVVVQTADICPQPKVYGLIQKEIDNGNKAVLFHLENSVIHHNIWHTNFFAVLDEDYWPPLSPAGSPDILEVQWGNYLSAKNLRHYFTSHNYKSKRFVHKHESESLPPISFVPLKKSLSVNMYIKGDKRASIWTKIVNFFRWIFRRKAIE